MITIVNNKLKMWEELAMPYLRHYLSFIWRCWGKWWQTSVPAKVWTGHLFEDGTHGVPKHVRGDFVHLLCIYPVHVKLF